MRTEQRAQSHWRGADHEPDDDEQQNGKVVVEIHAGSALRLTVHGFDTNLTAREAVTLAPVTASAPSRRAATDPSGADGETRTHTAFAATPSRWCVYQFHHVGKAQIPQDSTRSTARHADCACASARSRWASILRHFGRLRRGGRGGYRGGRCYLRCCRRRTSRRRGSGMSFGAVFTGAAGSSPSPRRLRWPVA